MPRRTRKQLIEAANGNEDLAREECDEACRVLAGELHLQWRQNQEGAAN